MRAPIVCLCGSVRFKTEFLRVAQDQELEGRIVVMPNVFSKADNIDLTPEQLALLITIHDQKLELCDEVYVVDAPDESGKPYIGDSTKREIEIALKLKKPVRYLSEEKHKGLV
jgi:hypothetical protein